MILIDTHCHLDFPEIAGADRRCDGPRQQANIAQMVTICTKVREFSKIAPLPKNMTMCFARWAPILTMRWKKQISH